MRMPVGPFYSFDILSGPLAGPIRVPMLQSASEHGRNQISSTAMRIIDSRPPKIERKRRVARAPGPISGRQFRVAFSDPRRECSDTDLGVIRGAERSANGAQR